MLYPIKSANGHAGEYFFAFKIASVLKWPCRLMDIDIGIDAQVEILDDSTRLSTGRFVAFQVKAREKEGQTYFYTSQEHLAYWRELALPVFAVLVDLVGGKMYLHEIDLGFTYPLTDGGQVRVDFDLAKDKFKASSAKKIALAGQEASLKKVAESVSGINTYAKRVLSTIEESKVSGLALELLELMHQRFDIRALLDRAQGLASGLQVGQGLVDGAEQHLEEALSDLRFHMSNSMVEDWNDDGAVTAFIRE